MRKLVLIVLLILILGIVGVLILNFIFPTNKYSLTKFTNIDRIEVRTNSNQLLSYSEDSEKISSILSTLTPYDNEWTIPFGGTPVALIRLQFYSGESYQGSIGIEETFITSQRDGYFYYRATDVNLKQRFTEILDFNLKE